MYKCLKCKRKFNKFQGTRIGWDDHQTLYDACPNCGKIFFNAKGYTEVNKSGKISFWDKVKSIFKRGI